MCRPEGLQGRFQPPPLLVRPDGLRPGPGGAGADVDPVRPFRQHRPDAREEGVRVLRPARRVIRVVGEVYDAEELDFTFHDAKIVIFVE